jgi:hypothetical protein
MRTVGTFRYFLLPPLRRPPAGATPFLSAGLVALERNKPPVICPRMPSSATQARFLFDRAPPHCVSLEVSLFHHF